MKAAIVLVCWAAFHCLSKWSFSWFLVFVRRTKHFIMSISWTFEWIWWIFSFGWVELQLWVKHLMQHFGYVLLKKQSDFQVFFLKKELLFSTFSFFCLSFLKTTVKLVSKQRNQNIFISGSGQMKYVRGKSSIKYLFSILNPV